MKNWRPLLYIVIMLMPFRSWGQSRKTRYSSSIWNEYPKRIIISDQSNVCITDKQSELVLVGFEQRQLFYNQLVLSDSIINQKNLQITYLDAKLQSYQNEIEVIDSIIDIKDDMTRKEKRRQWWSDKKDKLIIGGLSLLATIEAAFIVYSSLQ